MADLNDDRLGQSCEIAIVMCDLRDPLGAPKTKVYAGFLFLLATHR